MIKIIKIFTLIVLLNLLNACNAVQEGFSSKKKISSDEFFVEKKAPLVMPPNYDELPAPNRSEVNADEKNENIKKLISKEDIENSKKTETSISNNSLEKKVLDKIKN